MDDLPIKDKIAIVFHGIVGGMNGRNGIGEPSNIAICAKTIKYHVLSRYDCDVFMHSWSVDKEEELKSLYHPVALLFQPQELFDFTPQEAAMAHIDTPQSNAFCVTSRYNSLERAMKLKQEYEINNGFRYKWVFAFRYDLVFLKKIDISGYDNNNMHIVLEPRWPVEKLAEHNCVMDTIFLSNSKLMDEYSKLGTEVKNNVYGTKYAHQLAYKKLMNMFNNDVNRIKFAFMRWVDVEPYRMVMKPEPGPDPKSRTMMIELEKLLQEINSKENTSNNK